MKNTDTETLTIQNIAAYKFVDLPAAELADLRQLFMETGLQYGLKGTVLLSPEGINLFVAGAPENIAGFWKFVTARAYFMEMTYKTSFSDYQPFKRMAVKIRKEIITMGESDIRPAVFSSPHIPAAELKRWLDEGRDFTLLDTRNAYEVNVGTFEKAVHLNIDNFSEFPEAVDEMDSGLKEKPLVMFCTGGIRCEKAAPLMLKKGFQTVLQLDGGILKYFEDCRDTHYEGECFVFDQRVTLDGNLKETGAVLCRRCGTPFTKSRQADVQCDRENCPMRHDG